MSSTSVAAVPLVPASLRLACLPPWRGRCRPGPALDGHLSAGALPPSGGARRVAASTPRAAHATRLARVGAAALGASRQPSFPDDRHNPCVKPLYDSMHERDLKCANSTYFEKVERKEEKTWTYARRLLQLLRDNDPSLTTLDLTTDVVGDLLPPSGRFAGSELEGALVHNTAVTGMSIDDLSRSCERSSGPQASLHALKALRGCALPLSLKVRNWEAVRCLVDALGDEEPQGGRAAEHGGVAMHEIMVFKLDVASIGIELGPEGLEALLSLRMSALTEHLRT